MANFERNISIRFHEETRDDISAIDKEARVNAPFPRLYSRIVVPNQTEVTIAPLNGINSYNIEVEMKEPNNPGEESWTQFISCEIDGNGDARLLSAQRRNGTKRDKNFTLPSVDVVIEAVRDAGNKRSMRTPSACYKESDTDHDNKEIFFANLGSPRYIPSSPEVTSEPANRSQNPTLTPIPSIFTRDDNK